MSTLQTLDRGIEALKFISRTPRGVTIADLAAKLDVHRSIAHRVVSTLEAHSLITRTNDGLIFLSTGLLELASHFQPQFRAISQPVINELADKTQATAFISIATGDDCVVLMVAEPEGGMFRVSYRIGSKHPLSAGAAGVAILAGRKESASDSEEVIRARGDGFSVTRGVLQKGAVGVASPIFRSTTPNTGLEACIGVVAMDDLDVKASTEAVKSAAEQLAQTLSSDAGNPAD